MPVGEASVRECKSKRGVSTALPARTKTRPRATSPVPSGRRKRIAEMRPPAPISMKGRRSALVNHGAIGLGPGRDWTVASYFAPTGQIGMQVPLPQQAGRPSCATELRAWGVQPHLVWRALQSAREDAVEPGTRNRRLRKRAGPRRAEVLVRVSYHAQFALGFEIERFKFGVINGPVDGPAEIRVHAKIARHIAHAGAEPMPGSAADGLQIGAFENVRAGLPIPVATVQGVRKLGFGQPFVWNFRRLDWGVEEGLKGDSPIDPGTGFQNSRAEPGAGSDGRPAMRRRTPRLQ